MAEGAQFADGAKSYLTKQETSFFKVRRRPLDGLELIRVLKPTPWIWG